MADDDVKRKEELNNQLKEYISEWRKTREKEEDELSKLKEKQAKRKESRKNESRRASVVSISGEDHGLKSIGKWTKAVKAVTAAREDGREEESTSEQKEPDREVSPDELSWPGRLLVAADMLKYLLSCLTAPSMSACCCWGKFQVLSLLGLDGPPYIGSCLIGPVTFFSGTRSGLFCISSRAWIKWHRGP